MKFSILHHSTVAIAVLATGIAFSAAAFPLKPIRLVTALPGGNDAYVRVLAARFAEQMGQPVLVDNRTGGSFVPSAQAVSRRAARWPHAAHLFRGHADYQERAARSAF